MPRRFPPNPNKRTMNRNPGQPEEETPEEGLPEEPKEDEIEPSPEDPDALAETEEQEAGEGEEEGDEEETFDLEAQIELFRQQIEEEPEVSAHHYNLGEALMELGDKDGAKEEFERALQFDADRSLHSIIHFSLGELYYDSLISGIQSTVVKSSVGLHSAHKPGGSITEVHDDDYANPIREYESALQHLSHLKADDEFVQYISQNTPQRISDAYYKWGSDLLDKSRQIQLYGEEVPDVKQALRYFRKTMEINPHHSQAKLMINYAKKMLREGWQIYDEYGFVAKEIPGSG